MDFFSANQQ
jgi:hypothetical protein